VKILVFLDVRLCSVVDEYKNFGQRITVLRIAEEKPDYK
jgi:hypothetical protein